jgi:hypothetical protein
VLTGASAAAARGWDPPDVDGLAARPDFDGYMSEQGLAHVVERAELEPASPV